MSNIIYILLASIAGGVLASANVRVSNWQFWVILFCICGANLCGYISGMNK